MPTGSLPPALSRSSAATAPVLGAWASTPQVDFQARAADAANLLKALAHPDRLLLLCQLVDGERSVTELGVLAGIEQPSLSQQLGVLRGERLVTARREGKHIIYRIASPSALTLLQTLHGLFCEAPAPHGMGKNHRSVGRGTRQRKETE